MRSLGKCGAPTDWVRARTVNDGRCPPVPPIVHVVDESSACVQEQVVISGSTEPASADTTVYAERIEIALVREVQRWWQLPKPDEPQLAIGPGHDSAREAFARRDGRSISCITHAEAARERIEPMSGLCGRYQGVIINFDRSIAPILE
jgi:hypothetical protein